MGSEFSVMVGQAACGDVLELCDVQLLGSGLSLDDALELAASSEGIVVAPESLPT